ncbi:MAG: carboxypeptidase-like regulatory domain-containing protein, partial [Bacteroidota bacterium]
MRTLLLLPVLLLFIFSGYAQERMVKGTVTDGKQPLAQVNINNLNKSTSTITDDAGTYSISVETGDQLQFSYTGMKTFTIRIEDVTRFLNPAMVPDIEELDEVVVNASRRRSQKDLELDYSTNKRIIKTAYGYLDGDRSAGLVRILDGDDINPVYLCVLDLLRNRFPGITVFGNCSGTPQLQDSRGNLLQGGVVYIRGFSSVSNARPAVFDVDGQIFTTAPIWIDVNNIRRLAVLNNFATSAQYGNLGTGGVIIINTLAGTQLPKQFRDQARLRNNYADGKALSENKVLQNAPTYLQELNEATSLEEAKATFESYSANYTQSPYFVLDAYQYFTDRWDATNYADNVIEESKALFQNNSALLKALAYHYEAQGRYTKAHDLYKEVFMNRPNYVQSYRDLANSYRNIKEPSQAAAIHARYDYLIKEGFLNRDTTDFDPIMTREFNNLLFHNKRALVKGSNAKNLFVAEEELKGTRLVFEWNDGEADFELQFVNPENQYFKWKHTLADSGATIAREKEYGYSMNEELMD